MTTVPIIKWKQSAKILAWTVILGFLSFIIIVISFDNRALNLAFFCIAFLSGLILTFMNKAKNIGVITFGQNKISVTIDGQKSDYDYCNITNLNFNNYDGQPYFSVKNIYPFRDGLGNTLTLQRNADQLTVEILIKDKYTYQELDKQLAANSSHLTGKNRWIIKHRNT